MILFLEGVNTSPFPAFFRLGIKRFVQRITHIHLITNSGEQGWCSGESAHLPPMWPGFNSRSQCHMWVEFVVGSRPCSERFFSRKSGFPLSAKTNTSKFLLDLERTNPFKQGL